MLIQNPSRILHKILTNPVHLKFNKLNIIIWLLLFPALVFSQNKDEKKSAIAKIKNHPVDSVLLKPIEKGNFDMRDIESQLQKINYKPNEIAITVPNPRIPRRTPLKQSDFAEEKKKIVSMDTVPKKHPVYVPPLEVKPTMAENETKPSSPAETAVIEPATGAADSATVLKKESGVNEFSGTDSLNVSANSAALPMDTAKSIAPAEKENSSPSVAENPFRKEVLDKPALTPEEQLEQTYSELLIQNKDSLSNQSPLFIKKKELDFPMILEEDWKKVTREKMDLALSEQKTLNQRLNQLLKNYYTLNNLTQAAHSHNGSESVNDSLNREMVKVYYFLGIAYYNGLEMNQAAESFRKVIQIISDHEPSFKNISMIYQTNKNHGDEIKNLKSAIYSSDNEKK